VFPRDMVCLRNIYVDTLQKRDIDEIIIIIIIIIVAVFDSGEGLGGWSPTAL
jgi:hypothetical protein